MSTSLQWEMTSAGEYCLTGELDRNSVPDFWRRRIEWLPKDNDVKLNLSGLKRVDSAGMAMLLHLQNSLNNNSQQLTLLELPEQLKVLLTLSNVDNLLTGKSAA
ncbi:STAS domain-containing protein [Veronia pacifica]|uniref:Anti-sigma B factor antagonist n=1 Tax=Veronia pacifica TaxID=1080227 RepID=A0A1C3ELK9_9GAMM|nr:STAS domain-containing protein [Veronia pacifica]ODA34114.1 anti-sigma B factor antagonist [Veronia pacifica]